MTRLLKNAIILVIIGVMAGCAVYPSRGAYYSPGPYFSHHSYWHHGGGFRRW